VGDVILFVRVRTYDPGILEQDYVRKMTETLQTQVVRRNSAAEKNTQRTDIDETMGEGGGDEEEDGESVTVSLQRYRKTCTGTNWEC